MVSKNKDPLLMAIMDLQNKVINALDKKEVAVTLNNYNGKIP